MIDEVTYEIVVHPGRVVLTFNQPQPVLTKVINGQEIDIFSDDYVI